MARYLINEAVGRLYLSVQWLELSPLLTAGFRGCVNKALFTLVTLEFKQEIRDETIHLCMP
jgi:hypothetical protein